MSTNHPAGKRRDPDPSSEEPGQDESGKTAAPQSEPGPGRVQKGATRDEGPAKGAGAGPAKECAGDDDAAQEV